MNRKPVNFEKLVQQVVTAPKVGQDTLSIWGGECAEAEALTLLQQWSNAAEMPYRIWEYTDQLDFEENTLSDDARWLERGRLFGPGGDLSLRRDGDRFLWHFVGQAEVKPPAVGQPQDFWQAEPEASFHQNVETALLWGKHQENDHWQDDRVAMAKLTYPVASQSRLQVTYRTYSRAGRVEFVWFYGVEGDKNA